MAMKLLLTAGAAALLLPLASGAAQVQTSGQSRWNGEMSFTLTPAETGRPDRVNLSLRHGEANRRSHHSRTMALSELEGIGPADFLAGDGGPVRFRIAREAGTVDCTGSVRGMRGTGNCRFVPDEAFAAELARRGIGRPNAEEQFQLAMAGVGRPLIAELVRQGYPRPNVAQLVAIGIHGADVDYLRGLEASGYRLRSLERLVEFRIHGVTPQYLAEMSALGGEFRQMPPERLVEMRIHGVTPAYVREMAEAGYTGLTARQLIDLHIHGVRAEDARAINAAIAQAPGH